MKGSKQKTGRKDLKLKRDPPPWGSLREILQWGAGSSGEPSGETVATSEPAVELPVESRKESVAENLPEAQLNLLSWESVVLTYHCRELTFPANLQQERERDT
jgi:hypothetical protein